MIDPKQMRRLWWREITKPEQTDSGASPLRDAKRLRCVECDNVYTGSPQQSLDNKWWLGYCAYCRQGVMLVPQP